MAEERGAPTPSGKPEPNTPKPGWSDAVKDYGGAYLSAKHHSIGPRGAAFRVVGHDVEWNSKSEAWDPTLKVADPDGGDEPLTFRLNATNRKFLDLCKITEAQVDRCEVFLVKADTYTGPGLRIVDVTPQKA